MKTILLLLLISCLCFSQNREARKQKRDSLKTEIQNYTWQKGDKLPPGLAGVFSAIIPGTGQLLSGNYLDGLKYFGLNIVGYSAAVGSLILLYVDNSYSILAIPLITLYWLFYIKNISNAVGNAKLYNLEKRNSKVSIKLQPVLQTTPLQTHNYALGLGVKVTF